MLYLDISFFLHTIVADQNQIICTLGIKGNLSFFLSFLVKRIPTYQCCGSNSNDFGDFCEHRGTNGMASF